MDTSAIENAALPVFLFVIVTVGMGIAMIASGWLVGPHRQGKVKAMPYESGMDPIHDTKRRFDVRFHLVAIAFLVFDVELLFLYPWAVASRPAPIRDYTVAAVADATSKEVYADADSNMQIKMPTPSAGEPNELPPIKIQLKANADGTARIKIINEKEAGDFAELRQKSAKGAIPNSSDVTSRPPLGIDKAVAEGQIESRGLVFGGAMAFIALLLVGLIYDWRKGVFQWR